jgi:hypothetical protein
VTALTKIVDHILKEMDRGNYTGVLLLDFKKMHGIKHFENLIFDL